MKTRQRILTAAKKLADESSISNVTLSEVARLAGVSRQTVYRLVGGEKQLKELLVEGCQAGEAPADTQQRLLIAAGHVFAKYGYTGASLDQVAAEAGLTKGAIYSRFKSKSHLFMDLVEHRLQQQCNMVFSLIGEIVRAPQPEIGVSAIVGMHLASIDSDPDWPRLFLEFISQSRDPDIQTRLTNFLKNIFDSLGQLVTELKHNKVIAEDLDPFQVALLTNAIGNGLMLQWLINPAWLQTSGLEDGLGRILWRGLSSGNQKT